MPRVNTRIQAGKIISLLILAQAVITTSNLKQNGTYTGEGTVKGPKDGYFVENFEYFPCPPQCKTCESINRCLSCSEYRKLKNITELFIIESVTCVYKNQYIAIGFVILLSLSLLIVFCMKFLFCTKVSQMQEKFLVISNGNNYVTPNQVLQRPQDYNAGAGPQNHGYIFQGQEGGENGGSKAKDD